jgi:endonuclease-3
MTLIQSDKKRVSQIFDLLSKEINVPETELEFDENPYTLLVAVILSARSTDRQVNKATEPLFKIVDTPKKMLELGLEGLYSYINTVGLYKSKGTRIIGCSKILVEKYDSKLPETREELMELPGIGRKSADVILNVIHQKPTVAVDTHVFRVATRLELSDAKTRDKMAEELERELPKVLSDEQMQVAHHLLVLHGRYVCKARKPSCEKCLLYDVCKSKDKREVT